MDRNDSKDTGDEIFDLNDALIEPSLNDDVANYDDDNVSVVSETESVLLNDDVIQRLEDGEIDIDPVIQPIEGDDEKEDGDGDLEEVKGNGPPTTQAESNRAYFDDIANFKQGGTHTVSWISKQEPYQHTQLSTLLRYLFQILGFTSAQLKEYFDWCCSNALVSKARWNDMTLEEIMKELLEGIANWSTWKKIPFNKPSPRLCIYLRLWICECVYLDRECEPYLVGPDSHARSECWRSIKTLQNKARKAIEQGIRVLSVIYGGSTQVEFNGDENPAILRVLMDDTEAPLNKLLASTFLYTLHKKDSSKIAFAAIPVMRPDVELCKKFEICPIAAMMAGEANLVEIIRHRGSVNSAPAPTKPRYYSKVETSDSLKASLLDIASKIPASQTSKPTVIYLLHSMDSVSMENFSEEYRAVIEDACPQSVFSFNSIPNWGPEAGQFKSSIKSLIDQGGKHVLAIASSSALRWLMTTTKEISNGRARLVMESSSGIKSETDALNTDRFGTAQLMDGKFSIVIEAPTPTTFELFRLLGSHDLDIVRAQYANFLFSEGDEDISTILSSCSHINVLRAFISAREAHTSLSEGSSKVKIAASSLYELLESKLDQLSGPRSSIFSLSKLLGSSKQVSNLMPARGNFIIYLRGYASHTEYLLKPTSKLLELLEKSGETRLHSVTRRINDDLVTLLDDDSERKTEIWRTSILRYLLKHGDVGRQVLATHALNPDSGLFLSTEDWKRYDAAYKQSLEFTFDNLSDYPPSDVLVAPGLLEILGEKAAKVTRLPIVPCLESISVPERFNLGNFNDRKAARPFPLSSSCYSREEGEELPDDKYRLCWFIPKPRIGTVVIVGDVWESVGSSDEVNLPMVSGKTIREEWVPTFVLTPLYTVVTANGSTQTQGDFFLKLLSSAIPDILDFSTAKIGDILEHPQFQQHFNQILDEDGLATLVRLVNLQGSGLKGDHYARLADTSSGLVERALGL